MMKLMTTAAAVALLVALATPTGANFSKDVARHRQRRGAYCDMVMHTVKCSQKAAGSACTSDANCAIDANTGKCSADAAKMIAVDQAEMNKAVLDLFRCAFTMATDEAACKAGPMAVAAGVDCVWQAGGDGKMECGIDESAMLSGIKDPTMKKMLQADIKCKAIKDTAACSKDSDCTVEGTKCAGDGIKYANECLATTAASAGGSVAKGCAKFVDMAVDCAAKTAKAACTGDCQWEDHENFCNPVDGAAAKLMANDPDGQAFYLEMKKPGVMPECSKMNGDATIGDGKCDRLKATCSACTAKSDVCEFKQDVDGASTFVPTYTCEDNGAKMMQKFGCGSQASRIYKVDAQKSRAMVGKLAERSAAAKTKVAAAKAKVAACTAGCTNKAELEAAVTTAEAEVTTIAAASTRATADAAAADKEAAVAKDLKDTNGAGGLASAAAAVLAGCAAALLSL